MSRLLWAYAVSLALALLSFVSSFWSFYFLYNEPLYVAMLVTFGVAFVASVGLAVLGNPIFSTVVGAVFVLVTGFLGFQLSLVAATLSGDALAASSGARIVDPYLARTLVQETIWFVLAIVFGHTCLAALFSLFGHASNKLSGKAPDPS